MVEAEAVHRVIALAELVDQPIQLFHVTCAAAAEEVARAQARGVKVFAETCPHYLAFTADNLDAPSAVGAKFLCSPALRTHDDQASLWHHINAGTIGNITSDHAPYNLHGPDGKFWAGTHDVRMKPRINQS
jgi:dihydropyrimidinase